MGVAEMAENHCLDIAVANLLIKSQRAGVTVDGVSVVAQVLVRNTEAVQRISLTSQVAQLLLQGQSLLAVFQCVGVIPQKGVEIANVIERAGLPGRAADGLIRLMSGPGCRPSSRNIRAAGSLSCW